jgi:hypothetical protein
VAPGEQPAASDMSEQIASMHVPEKWEPFTAVRVTHQELQSENPI